MTQKWVVTDPDILRAICIKNDWFTGGTVTQYNKMFELNRKDSDKDAKRNHTIYDVALAIWLCSDADYDDIFGTLDDAQTNYLMDLAEGQIAAGERAADEVYCGYFD